MTDLLEPTDDTPTPPPTDERGEGTPAGKFAVLAALIALAGFFGGVSMVVVIAAIVVMIFLHELGHYLAARWGGMKVTEFFIGFGPRIWSFQRGETEYGLKVIPAGAYVRVIGMNSIDDEHDPAEEHRTYRQASFPKRMVLAVAGSGMHMVQAFVALFVVFSFVGVPADAVLSDDELAAIDEPPIEVEAIVEDSAAEAAGVRPGDVVVAVDGIAFDRFVDLATYISARPDEAATVTIDRDGTAIDLDVVFGEAETPDGETRGLFGIDPVDFEYPLATVGIGEGLGEAVDGVTGQVGEIFGFLGRFFSVDGLKDFGETLSTADAVNDTIGSVSSGNSSAAEDASDRPISLIGAVRLGSDITDEGLWGFLLFFASINVTIGVVNLLPFPPLDGGHVAVAVYERVRELRTKGRRYIADYGKVIPVAYLMIFVLGFVFLTTAYLDILDAV